MSHPPPARHLSPPKTPPPPPPASSPPSSERGGLRWVRFLLLTFFFAVFFANWFHPIRRHSPVRRCYANLKTLSGALEMYALDFNKKLESGFLDQPLGRLLVKEGYLQEFPRHFRERPEELAKNAANYYLDANSGYVLCLRHGHFRKTWTPASKILLELGHPDDANLAAVREREDFDDGIDRSHFPYRAWSPREREFLPWILAALLALPLSWQKRRSSAPEKEIRRR